MNTLNGSVDYLRYRHGMAGTTMSCGIQRCRQFYAALDAEIGLLFKHRSVDNDQSLWTALYFRHPDWFNVHYGHVDEMFTNYYAVVANRPFVLKLQQEYLQHNDTFEVQRIQQHLDAGDRRC